MCETIFPFPLELKGRARYHWVYAQWYRAIRFVVSVPIDLNVYTVFAMTMDHSDRELIDGCLAGDDAASKAFVRRFSRLVYGSILGVTKSKSAHISQQDVEDLHNTVFVAFFENNKRKLRQFEGRNGCSLASWVRMVTARAVLDFLRRRRDPLSRSEQLTSLELIPEPTDRTQTSALGCMVAKEQRDLIEKGLLRLKPRDRLVIQLHCLEEHPLNQVADILDVSEANIHSVKHRAIKRLQAAVAELMKKSSANARTP